MKKYAVAIANLFDNEVVIFIVEEENEYQALKKAMIESTNNEYKQDEISWQEDLEYPKTFEDLISLLHNSDYLIDVKEI